MQGLGLTVAVRGGLRQYSLRISVSSLYGPHISLGSRMVRTGAPSPVCRNSSAGQFWSMSAVFDKPHVRSILFGDTMVPIIE